MAVNYSPRASYEARAEGELIEGSQLRVMAAARGPFAAAWHAGARLETERTDRDVTSLGDGNPLRPDFERRMYRFRAWIEAPERRRAPEFGIEYFRLDESGWFGRNLAASGENRRREVTVFAAGNIRTGERNHLEPVLSISHVDYERDFVEQPGKFREEDEWIVTLGMPWRHEMDKDSGALITLNPTFRLNSLGFGGGNIQVHWPL